MHCDGSASLPVRPSADSPPPVPPRRLLSPPVRRRRSHPRARECRHAGAGARALATARSPRAPPPPTRAPLLRGPVAPSLPVRSPPLLSPGPRARELRHAGPRVLVTTSSLRAPPPPSHGPFCAAPDTDIGFALNDTGRAGPGGGQAGRPPWAPNSVGPHPR